MWLLYYNFPQGIHLICWKSLNGAHPLDNDIKFNVKTWLYAYVQCISIWTEFESWLTEVTAQSESPNLQVTLRRSQTHTTPQLHTLSVVQKWKRNFCKESAGVFSLIYTICAMLDPIFRVQDISTQFTGRPTFNFID